MISRLPPRLLHGQHHGEVGDGIPEVHERVAAYRRRIERALKVALDVAEAVGDIEAGSSQDRARLIQAALFGAFAASEGRRHNGSAQRPSVDQP